MEAEESARRPAEAAADFNRHENRDDGMQVAGSLAAGLIILRDSLYERVHHDVEIVVGKDSMLMPLSEKKAEQLAKLEIDLYQISVSAATAREFGYISTDDDWFLRWLTGLRLGEAQADAAPTERLARYWSATPAERRLAFTNVLTRALPESRRAPLVLFRLVPLSVGIVTALAFADHQNASEIRSRQVALLPAISDCGLCRGRLLENGEQCPQCGNPLWKYRWLTAAD